MMEAGDVGTTIEQRQADDAVPFMPARSPRARRPTMTISSIFSPKRHCEPGLVHL